MIDFAKLILRLAVGGLLLLHGIHKLIYGFAGIKGMLVAAGLPEWLWIGVVIGEIVAPLLLIIGVCTKISSLMVFFTMLFAMYLAFGWSSFSITSTGGLEAELNLLYAVSALAITFLGHGKFALQKKDKGIFS
jgi:putative oxidoreductase